MRKEVRMSEGLEKLMQNMTDAGCSESSISDAARLYKAGRIDELKTCLKKCRCEMIEELHESQRKVDCLDYLIRQTDKAKKEKR